jgi:hypothetical protein
MALETDTEDVTNSTSAVSSTDGISGNAVSSTDGISGNAVTMSICTMTLESVYKIYLRR